MSKVKLANRRIVGDYVDPYIVAELNTSHFGDLKIAKNMILQAKNCGCDCVKLQSWSSSSLYSKSFYKSNKMAKRFYDKFSLSSDQIIELIEFSKSISIDISSTPYSIEEAKFLAEQNYVPFIKIASMEINNHKYLNDLGGLGKPLILSTGMSSIEEVSEALSIIEGAGNNQIIILHCVSIYPSTPNQINLNNILGLREKFPNYPIGFSDHTKGISIPIASVALGACLIEKHFTLNNEKIGLDNQMATEPSEMIQLVSSCKEVFESLGKHERILSDYEMEQRFKMRRSLVSNKSMKKGQIITENDISIKRPGDGIPPNKLNELIGNYLIEDIEEETQFTWDKLQQCSNE